MKTFDDLSGRECGIWQVIKFDHMEYHGANQRHGMSYYECRCKKCGGTFIKPRSHLLQNKNQSHNGCPAEVDDGVI